MLLWFSRLFSLKCIFIFFFFFLHLDNEKVCCQKPHQFNIKLLTQVQKKCKTPKSWLAPSIVLLFPYFRYWRLVRLSLQFCLAERRSLSKKNNFLSSFSSKSNFLQSKISILWRRRLCRLFASSAFYLFIRLKAWAGNSNNPISISQKGK